ncbi:MAG: HAD hydrolase family protein [Elusimicrobia bacterium]|nr:HAD hydrolase family protein [Elusimicrobiota bacterium]
MPPLTPRALRARLRRVRLVLMDVDGVLTDGRIFHLVDTKGELVEFKGIGAQDAIALTWLAARGIQTGVISGRKSRGAGERLKLLGMTHIHQGRLDKKAVFAGICRRARIRPEETVYMGDDLPDLPVIRAAGVGAAPADARPEVRAAAAWVARREGGRGAVRELCEAVLKAQGLWPQVLDCFR